MPQKKRSEIPEWLGYIVAFILGPTFGILVSLYFAWKRGWF